MPNQIKVPTAFSNYFDAFSAFKLPAFDLNAMLSMQHKNFEAMATASRLVLEGLQTVARRQAEFATELVGEGLNGNHLFKVATQQEGAAKQADVFKVVLDKGLSNLREVTNVLVKSGNDATNVLAKRVSENLSQVTEAA
jgi:phasin family protein